MVIPSPLLSLTLVIDNKIMSKFEFQVEIYEGEGGDLTKNATNKAPDFAKEGICAWMYRGDGKKSYSQGMKFKYPEDAGKLCPWILDSINMVVRVLSFNGTLPWTYENTNYKKDINHNGITTEFIRCVDPTKSGIVIKVIRKEK